MLVKIFLCEGRLLQQLRLSRYQLLWAQSTILLCVSGQYLRFTCSLRASRDGWPGARRASQWECSVLARGSSATCSAGRRDGTGLGLAYTQRVINEHGGRIDCATARGKGSTFSIQLPLAVGA